MIKADARCGLTRCDICDITLRHVNAGGKHISGAIPPPPAALAAWRKLLTIAWPQVTEFWSSARKKPRKRI